MVRTFSSLLPALLLWLCGAAGGNAQSQMDRGTLTGRITSASTQQPIPGAVVTVLGTQLQTLSQADGSFTIAAVPTGPQRVRASAMGFDVQVQSVTMAPGQTATLNFALPARAVELEALVVTGYGTATRQQLPSAVEVVDAEELKGVTTENVATMLQGKVAGVTVARGSGEPGSAPQVRIRGTGSILAHSDPLYVVDGVIADGSMAQSIPAENISSVSVLKDAAATALYGSRAANGVLVITTRSGRAGKTQLRISSSVGVTDANFGEFDVMNSRELYDLQSAMRVRGLTEEVLARDTDWRGLAFRQGRVADVNLSASGGDERTRFFAAGGYYQEDGTVRSTGFDRFSGRVNLEHAVNDRFNITARAYGSYENRLSNPTDITRGAYINLPWDTPHDGTGTLKTGREPDWIGRERRNFLYEMQYDWSNGRAQDFGGDLVLDYDLTSWLSFSTTNRATFEYQHSELYRDARTPGGSSTSGSVGNTNGFGNSLLTSNLFRGDREFGDHSLDGLIGFEYQRNYGDNLSGTGIGIFPGLAILNVTAEPRMLRGGKFENAFASVLSQVNYGFLERYFLTGSYRRDASSRFGADNLWGDFYSVAGAWLLSNEAFMQDLPAVHQLKLRASYGTTGNAEIGDYLAQSLYSFDLQYDGGPGSAPVRVANPNLTWEVARTLNLGLDLGLFDRVDLTLDVYQRVNDDLLQNVEQPKTTGFQFRTMNVGAVQNRGVELGLSIINLDGAFTWTSDFNIAVNRNKVLSLYNDSPILRGQQRILEGRDINTWFQRKWLGVDPANGDPLWEKVIYGKNGEVVGREATNNYNQATLQVVGSATPDFTGGMRNTLGFGGLTLSAFVNFLYGNDLYHDGRGLFDGDGAYTTYNSMRLREGWNRWEKPGDVATHPRPVSGGNRLSNRPSSRYLEDGSYLRLRDITLSYSVPASLLPHLRIGSAQVYLSGENLLTLTRFSGMDPEEDFGGQVGYKYPISKKVLVGIQMGM